MEKFWGWIGLVVYAVIYELIRRSKAGSIMSERVVALEKELSKKKEEERGKDELSSFLEADRYVISKFKSYYKTLQSRVRAKLPDEDTSSADLAILNSVLRMENKVKAHLESNHFGKISGTSLSKYIDHVTSESMGTMTSYLTVDNDEKDIGSSSSTKGPVGREVFIQLFSESDVRRIVSDIIDTAISIKSRVKENSL